VCAKPLRFSHLPDSVAITFAEIGDVNCYYVFETRDDARRQLAQIPPDDRVGRLFSVIEVAYLRRLKANDGPKLDPCGFPFRMRGFIVDKSGAVTKWGHRGRFGWRGLTAPRSGSSDEAGSSLTLRLRKR